jgi:VWFA-related protein
MRKIVRFAALAVLLAIIVIGTAAAQRDTIRTQVDLVVVPLSVRDGNGKLIYDLGRQDFSVFEDGRAQEIRQLSVDPSPLSVAVLVDSGVGGAALGRVAASMVSVTSAFADIDEAAVYRFDHVVTKLADFTTDHEGLDKSFAVIQKIAEGKGNISTSPLSIAPGRGPRWLRWLLDHGAESRVLDDAMFTAATELENRAPGKRRVIITISDGQVAHSEHSMEEARARLVGSQIQVYAITVGLGLIGGPTSSLRAYADATGGDVYGGRTQNDMESAFAHIAEQARHQYVLSYVSNNEVSGRLPVTRQIEVKVSRPGLTVRHRQSYLQYPAARN